MFVDAVDPTVLYFNSRREAISFYFSFRRYSLMMIFSNSSDILSFEAIVNSLASKNSKTSNQPSSPFYSNFPLHPYLHAQYFFAVFDKFFDFFDSDLCVSHFDLR